MKNYHVFSLENQTFNPEPMTLKQAMQDIKHSAPFGIFNATTGKIVVIRILRGFCFPLNTIRQFETRCNEIVKKYHTFDFHPQQ